MGEQQSKPKKPMSAEEVMRVMDQHPDVVLQYYHSNKDEIENFVMDNFWEEDVERWLLAIRKRSPKEHLQVRKVDFLKSINTVTHETSRYENKDLVVRRSASFLLDVSFGNRSFDPERDDISVIFNIGAAASESNGTKITCVAKEKAGPKTKWHCIVNSVDHEAKKVTLKINIPANAIVGRYSVALNIVSGTQSGRSGYTHKDASVIVIFNPLSKDDAVYMEDPLSRGEYVFNDEGFINTGNYGYRGEGIHKRCWEFAQFDEGVLDSVLLMMQNDTRMIAQPIKSLKKCNSPVFLSRLLAAMVNSNDDKGVLSGKWDGDYLGGKKPTFWNNSAKILSEWRDNDLNPVKYGQCWVFSGVLTTALRALGIPARSVTNYESAHDTDRNQTVDIYYDSNTFERLEDTSDSIWNFHVWNECFFTRPDLPEGYGGWQVVDATPQEESDNVTSGSLMQCGPAPVKAVKLGETSVGFDTGFVFGEVNADKVQWLVDEDGTIKNPLRYPRAVGRFIGTKAIGKYETENIIEQYKYPEGSLNERKSFNKAYGLGTKEHGVDVKSEIELVKPAFDVTVQEIKNAKLGMDISTKITVKNITRVKEMAKMTITANSKRHNGRIHSLLKRSEQTIAIDNGEELSFTFKLAQDEYMRSIVDDYTISITTTVTSGFDGNTSLTVTSTDLEIPEFISVKKPQSVRTAELTSIDIVFENHLPIKLTNGVFEITGRGISSGSKTVKVGESIAPHQKYTVKDVKIYPKLGWRMLYFSASFDCAEMKDITHSFRIKVDM